jgi:hypothetical protein
MGAMVPKAGVGSILTPWDNKITWTCGAKPGIEVSTVDASGNAGATSEVSVALEGKLYSWASAQAKYASIDSIEVSLKDGKIESAALSDILLDFDRQPADCRGAIRAQERAGAKWFSIATKVYRGTIAVKAKTKQGVSAAVSADILKTLQSDLRADGSAGSESAGELILSGGVWIIESEPYDVPAPHEEGPHPQDDSAPPRPKPDPAMPPPTTTEPSAEPMTTPVAASACPVRCQGSGEATRLILEDSNRSYTFTLLAKRLRPRSEFHVLDETSDVFLVENRNVGEGFTLKPPNAAKVCSKLDGTGGGCHWSCSENEQKNSVLFFTDQMSADFSVSCQ